MRFGRRKDEPEVEDAAAVGQAAGPSPEQVGSGRENGPWDSTEVDLDAEIVDRVDLGALLMKGRDGLELRMQVDEATQTPLAAIVLAGDAAVELRPFAAPRGVEFWDEVRESIRDQVSGQGGSVAETDGPWGMELHATVAAVNEQGETVNQPSRVVGIRGPRWLLRATFFGRLSEAADPNHPLEQVVRDIVVVRPEGAMPPGTALPLRLPPGATV